jgi:hypothetical protein
VAQKNQQRVLAGLQHVVEPQQLAVNPWQSKPRSGLTDL